MSQRHAELGLSDSIRWEQIDVRDMESIPTASVDVAFDKGTLDAMIHGSPWSPPEDTLENTGKYLCEVSRILKPDGVFLYVTYRQPHLIKPLLECEGTNWDIEIETLSASGGSFGYCGIVCRPRHV
jgi:EEF1A lysine methyltransferase 4